MKLKQLLAASLVTLSLAGCEKNFLDVNTNPNSPTSATPNLVLPNATNYTAAEVNNTLNVLGNLWVGNWGQAPDFLYFVPQEQYSVTPSTYNTSWVNLYDNAIKNYEYVINNSASTQKNFVAVAQIMEAYSYQVLVDLWGDIPYTQAIKGTSVINPKYDPATAVYDSIMSLLNRGIANIDASAGQAALGTSDIVFPGSSLTTEMDKWKRFANTLKLRILIRQSLVPSRAAQVTAGFASLAGQSFLGAGENAGANPGFLNTATAKANPLYGYFYTVTTGAVNNNYKAVRANAFAVDSLTSWADPRLGLIYAIPPAGGTYKGVRAGSTAAAGNRSNDLSPVGTGVVKPTGYNTPAYILTASESFFLQAEAQLKGYLTGDPMTSYNKGVEESFKLLGSTAAAAQTYYTTSTNRKVNYTLALTQDQKMEAIITQKWIALNGFNGIEAWAEWRRTKYPTGNPLSLNQTSGGKYPVRLPYPQTEVAGNAANVPTLPNIFDVKIFWQVN